jgi:hypothetical protein
MLGGFLSIRTVTNTPFEGVRGMQEAHERQALSVVV